MKSAAEAAGKNRAVLKEDTNTRASYLLKQGIRPVVSIALLILLFSLLVDVNDVWTAIMTASRTVLHWRSRSSS